MTERALIALAISSFAFATPLLLAALGELIGERAGVLNIGLEGMMLTGALAGASASFFFAGAAWGLLAAMASGAALAAVFALLVIGLKADCIVVGTGLNLFALGLTGSLNRGLGVRFDALCEQQPARAACGSGGYHAVIIAPAAMTAVALLAAVALWWGLRATRTGLVLRAVGEHPRAAETAGIAVARVRWMATLFNGALCGAAGAFLAMSNTDTFAENMTAGRGFIALTVVIFGRFSPLGAVVAALLFGAAQASQNLLQPLLKLQSGMVIYPLLLMLPYVITLFTLAGFAGGARPPAALAVVDDA